jgi:NAD(P)-dependent dehydrogenase (short-subunit alcohol dehydrogenase family)
MDWTTKDIPSQSGRLAVITGASGGLGFEVAAILANKGAEIVVAARNADKGQTAATKLGRSARYEPLDLADLTSVKDFAARLLQRAQPISLLINNAGLAAPPKRQVTRDGFELQFGTNFLGHFLLTACLMPLLQKALSPRVVTVSSLVEKSAKIDLNDLMSEHNYSPTRSWGLRCSGTENRFSEGGITLPCLNLCFAYRWRYQQEHQNLGRAYAALRFRT